MKIVVTGGQGGLGSAIIKALMDDAKAGHETLSFDKRLGDDVTQPDAAKIERWLGGKLDVLINCAGINKQDWIKDTSPFTFHQLMDVNALGILAMTQACFPMLVESKGTILNITSNAAWMPMTCSIAYNASKGAAHIMTLQMARELTKKYGITVFGIAPNKLRGTGMSADIEREVLRTRGWDKEFAAQYQKNALLTGEETDPRVLADFIAFLFSSKERHKYLSGCIIPYGA